MGHGVIGTSEACIPLASTECVDVQPATSRSLSRDGDLDRVEFPFHSSPSVWNDDGSYAEHTKIVLPLSRLKFHTTFLLPARVVQRHVALCWKTSPCAENEIFVCCLPGRDVTAISAVNCKLDICAVKRILLFLVSKRPPTALLDSPRAWST